VNDSLTAAESKPRPTRNTLYLLALLAAYLLGRLLFLERHAVFIDEIIHITYARELLEGYLAAGAASGKWLSIQVMAPFVALPIDPLLAVRLASVAAGAGTLVAIYLIADLLFSPRAGRLASLYYIILPFAFFFNRQGLTDGIVTLIGAWTIFFSIRIVRSTQGFNLLPLTILLLAAPLAKLSGAVYLFVPLVAVLFLSPRKKWLRNGLRVALPVLGSLATAAALIYIGAGTSLAGQKTFSGDFQSLIRLMGDNLGTAFEVYWLLLTPIMAVFAMLTLLWGAAAHKPRGARLLVTVFSLVSLPYILLAQTWYPRYLLMSLVPLTLLLAEFSLAIAPRLSRFRLPKPFTSALPALALAALLLWPALTDVILVARPWSVSLPEAVRWQYINGWPAGYGARELAAFLEAESQKTPDGINVLRPPHVLHTYRGGLDLYLDLAKAGRVHRHVMLEGDVQDFQKLAGDLSAERCTFFVFDASHEDSRTYYQLISPGLDLTKVWSQPKPDSSLGFEAWEIRGPNC